MAAATSAMEFCVLFLSRHIVFLWNHYNTPNELINCLHDNSLFLFVLFIL